MKNNKKLSKFQKTACITAGAVVGALPPRHQLKIGELTNNNYDAATLMSLTSRKINIAVAGYGVASGICHLFGIDIDPMVGNLATLAGTVIAADTFVREGLNAGRYFLQGGECNTNYNIPWGSPILSTIDRKIFPQAYEKKESNLKEPILVVIN